jgi:hypothetical protein
VVNSGVCEGYFRLFIANGVYNLLKDTIFISNQQCKPRRGYATFDQRCWLFCITSCRSRWAWRPRIIQCFIFYFLLTLCFTDIDFFIGLWLFFQLPLYSIAFYLCQMIHVRNNKTMIHARNNETNKHASFKLTFRNIDKKWYVCCPCHTILSTLLIATILRSYRYVLFHIIIY